ncbi:MAG: AAA family ATPase [Betaproteobacteria bacterium]|nr:AAA family ATPase [Betaproteobacteria bacterium]
MNSCIAARVDLDQARRFLAVLAEGQPITFQTFDDDGVRKDNALARIVHGSLDASAPTLQQMNARGAGVYWMVNFGDCKGRRAKNVTDVRALFLDLDGAPLAPVLDAGVEPHAVVESSPGRWHVYWAVVGCAPPQFKAAQQALAARFGGDPSVCDLPRVLRVPGFLHSKGERFASRIERLVPMRPYAFGDLLQRLGLDLSLIVPKPVVQIERASGEIVDKVTHPGRHAHLLKWAAQLNWRGVPAEAVRVAVHAENMRVCEPPKTAVEVDAVVADVLKRYGAQHGRDLRQQEGRHMLDAGVAQEADDAASPLFTVVPVADLAHTSPAAPYYWWEGYLPAGVVTLLGAHGGAGKSTLALMLAVCIAQGLPLFGIPTKRGRVAIFSGEDGAELVRHRLHLICRRLGVNPAALAGWLHVIDATTGEPTLFHEVNLKGTKQGATTPSLPAARVCRRTRSTC